jgi:predicted metalloprotease with PDZ domain
LRQDGNKVVVRSIRSGSAAENMGLSVNDEVIGCNGFRVDQSSFETFLASLELGSEITILVARDELLFELSGNMTLYNKPQFQFKLSPDANKVKLLEYWLRVVE